MASLSKSFDTLSKFIPRSIIFLLAAAVVGQFYLQITYHNPKGSWEITEWLINYRGGFIRRGPPGEIILWLYHTCGANPYNIILWTSGLGYAAVAVFFTYAFRKKGYSIAILPFVFFMGNPVINGFLVRKDLLLILLLIGTIYFLTKKGVIALVLANMFMILALLSHEAIGFFGLPVMILILARRNDIEDLSLKLYLMGLLKAAPSLIAFLFVLLNSGTAIAANSIWQSWDKIPFPYPSSNGSDPVPPAAIGSLTAPLSQGLNYFIGTLSDFYGPIYAPLLWAIVIIAIYYVVTNINKINSLISVKRGQKEFHIGNLSTALVFQFIAVMPLFILGCDWGRWIFYWAASSFAAYMLVPSEVLGRLYPAFISQFALKVNHLFIRVLPASGWLVFLAALLIGFPALTSGPEWHIGLGRFYHSSAIGTIIDFLHRLTQLCSAAL